jgi:surfactin synthase thioesterase subunit
MPDSSWLVVRAPVRAPLLRIFALPYAGGNASVFDSWRSVLRPDAELCAVQLPGRHNRIGEPPLRRMSVLLQELEPVVAARLDCPYLIYGDCQGAITALELTRRLRRRARTAPRLLVVSSAEAPQVATPLPDYPAMDDPAFLADLVHSGLIPSLLADQPDLVEAALPALRADFELACSYRYREEAPLAIPVVAIRGQQDTFTAPDAARAWADLTTESFELITVPGGHDLLTSSESALPGVIGQICDAELARHGGADGSANLAALAAPDLSAMMTPYQAPRDDLEAALVRLCAPIVGVPRAGASLFDLGMTSLVAVQIAAAIRAQFQVEFPVARVLRYPTIEGLAAQLRELQGDWPGPRLPRPGSAS